MELAAASRLSALPNLLRFRRSPIEFLEERLRRSPGRIRFRLGPMSIALFTHPVDIERVYASTKTLERSSVMRTVVPITGESILVSSGETWKKKRLIAQPVFQPARIAALHTLMRSITEKRLAAWAVAGTQVIDMKQGAIDLTLEIVTEALFGRGISELPSSFYQNLDVLFDWLRTRIDNPLSFPEWVPTPANRRFHRALREMNDVVYGLIDERIAANGEGTDLLSILLRSTRGEDGSYDRESTRNEMITYFLAGFETTATTLTWAVYELARHPQYTTAIRKEAASATSSEAWLKLPTPIRVIKEALRLHPPAWFGAFSAVEETEINGAKIRRGEHVWVCQYLTQRDPTLWENAERFSPERFSEEQERDRHKYAFFPFGAANRHCIGQNFAMLELQIVLTLLCQRFDWSLVDDTPVEALAGFVLRPASAVRCRLTPLPVVQ